jgi:hypothetical protein
MLEPASREPLLNQGDSDLNRGQPEPGAGVGYDEEEIRESVRSSSSTSTNRDRNDGLLLPSSGQFESRCDVWIHKHRKGVIVWTIVAVIGIMTLIVLLSERKVQTSDGGDNGSGGEVVRGGHVGAWYYPRENQSEVSQVIQANSRVGGMQFLVISASVDELVNASMTAESVEYFYSIFNSTQSRVVIMTLQGPNFAFTESIPRALEHVQDAVNLCLALNYVEGKPAVVCNELHFDIEPHVLPEWRDANDSTKQDIIDQMAEVVQTSREAIDNATATLPSGEKIELSIAITWWYFSDKTGFNLDELMQATDCIYIMAYGGTGSSSKQLLDIVNLKANSTSEVVRKKMYYVGIGFQEFKSVEDCISASKEVNVALQSDPAYLGNCFYNLNYAM